jgi:hypothetical protein
LFKDIKYKDKNYDELLNEIEQKKRENLEKMQTLQQRKQSLASSKTTKDSKVKVIPGKAQLKRV